MHRALVNFVVFLAIHFSLAALFPSESAASPDYFAKIRALIAADKIPVAIQSLEAELAKLEEKDLALFQLAYLAYRNGQYEKSIEHFNQLKDKKINLNEYVHYFLAQAELKQGKAKEAEKNLNQVFSMQPNFRLKVEATLDLAKIQLENKEYSQARAQLNSVEKKVRGTEYYAKFIYTLARAEHGLKNKKAVCKWLKKIYIKYPTEGNVETWGPELSENQFEGEPSQCQNSFEDFRTRIKFLLWAGNDKKAQEEINIVREKIKSENPFLADELQAQFYLQEGEPVKALSLLKPHFSKFKNIFKFLTLYAATAARAGEIETAIGSYYAAHKLSPKSKAGKQALYQSAFLSYQFQDYDGAGRRFREFIKKYSTAGLGQDAKWHLAWLQYLKGDYAGAYNEFASLHKQSKANQRKRKGSTSGSVDRINYWMAMSLYRQGKIEQARSLFAVIAQDKLLGYYALAAQARLRKLPLPPAAMMRNGSYQPHRLTRFSMSEILMSAPEETDEVILSADEQEGEENLKLTELSQQEDRDESGEEQSATEMLEEKSQSEQVTIDEMDGKVSAIKSPALAERFMQARDLMIVGLVDWAKWDLYEVEKKTSNKDFLKTLMSEYSAVESYNRSSYIAHQGFMLARAKQGMDGARDFWQFAYPQAYANDVVTSAKDFNLPQELIWGIMRAESQYRRDAISPVGALGLMQVMPYTGRRVAQILNDRQFEPSKLLEPPTAVRIGSRYLARLMKKFDSSLPLVAAAYNAGPHRVQSWLISFGHRETDEFIEHIPFLETRNYVKKVMSNCQVYSNLYGKDKVIMVPHMADVLPVKPPTNMELKESWDEI